MGRPFFTYIIITGDSICNSTFNKIYEVFIKGVASDMLPVGINSRYAHLIRKWEIVFFMEE